MTTAMTTRGISGHYYGAKMMGMGAAKPSKLERLAKKCDSGSSGGNPVEVRVLSCAPFWKFLFRGTFRQFSGKLKGQERIYRPETDDFWMVRP